MMTNPAPCPRCTIGRMMADLEGDTCVCCGYSPRPVILLPWVQDQPRKAARLEVEA